MENMHTDVRVERDNVRLFTWWLISKGLEYKKIQLSHSVPHYFSHTRSELLGQGKRH